MKLSKYGLTPYIITTMIIWIIVFFIRASLPQLGNLFTTIVGMCTMVLHTITVVIAVIIYKNTKSKSWITIEIETVVL
jgi:uncharacterized membrane protein